MLTGFTIMFSVAVISV